MCHTFCLILTCFHGMSSGCISHDLLWEPLEQNTEVCLSVLLAGTLFLSLVNNLKMYMSLPVSCSCGLKQGCVTLWGCTCVFWDYSHCCQGYCLVADPSALAWASSHVCEFPGYLVLLQTKTFWGLLHEMIFKIKCISVLHGECCDCWGFLLTVINCKQVFEVSKG